MKANALIIILFGWGLSGSVLASDCPNGGGETQSSTRLDHFTWLQKVKGRESGSMLVAVLTVRNLGVREIVVPGMEVFGTPQVSFGGTGKVWTKEPGEDEWQEGVGATGSSRTTGKPLVIKAREEGEITFQWPLAYLVDYPAETLFRVGFVDSLGNCHSSEPFKLHDGKIKLTYRVLP